MPASIDQKTSDRIGIPLVREAAQGWLLVPALYCLASLALLPFGYKLFHFSVETGCVVIGMMALLVANISRGFTSSSLLVIAGSGLGWVAMLDFLHIITFEGMGLLPGDTTNLTSQLWIIGRMLQVLVLLAAVLFLEYKARMLFVHLGCGLFALLCLGLLYTGLFPATFVPGEGLTAFKIASEYLIIATLIAVAIQLQRKRGSVSTGKFHGIQLALGAMVLSELCFTRYVTMSDRFNEVGHLLKVFSYWFLFRALVVDTLLQPFSDRNRLLSMVGQRLKEMNSLNELARLTQLHEGDTRRFLAALVGVLPPAMLHDKVALARIEGELGAFGANAVLLPEHRCIAVPLLIEGRRVGTLKVGYPPQADLPEPLFLDEELALMELVGQRVNAVLECQHNQETIQQLNRLYRMLSGVNRAVVYSSSQSQLLAELFAILRDSQGFAVIGIAECNVVQERFRLAHAHQLATREPAQLHAELQVLAAGLWPDGLAHSSASTVFRTGTLAQPLLAAALRNAGSPELVVVPIAVHGEVLGLVLAGAPPGQSFHADETRLLDELGEDLGYAVSKLRQGQRLLEVEGLVEDSERRYEALFNQSPVPMTLMDASAQTVLARNRAYEQWLGSPLCEINDVQEWFSRVVVEPERAGLLMQQLAENAGKSFAPFGYFEFPETRLHDSSGRPLVATARLTNTDDRVLVVFNDITQLKEKESRLRDSEQRFRNMIEESVIGVMVVQGGCFVYVNPAFCALTGWDARTLVGNRLDAYAHPMTSAETGAAPHETTLDPALQRVYEFRRKDGSPLKLFASAGVMPWDTGAAEVMIVQDVTEKIRYELELRRSAALLENLAQQVPGVIYQFRLYPDGRSTLPFATRSLWDIYELHPEDVKDDAASVFQRLHPGDLAQVKESIGRSALELSLWRADYRVVLPQKGLRWRSGYARPQRLDDGSTLWHGFIEDSTARKEMEAELRSTNEMLQRSVSGTLEIISRIMDQRDPYTAGHQHRVGKIASLIGAELGLDRRMQEMLELTGIVHDVGKVAVPTEILIKPTRLSAIELQIVHGHASAGYEILKGTNLPRALIDAIHQHHERLDGSGYPQGLKGDQITREARIIAVADVLESMSSHRPYRPSLGIDLAVQELERGRGRIYDAGIVDAALKIVREQRLPAVSTIH